jgi:hypothetical protein
MAATTVERIVRDASQRGRLIGVRLVCDEDAESEPWKASPPRKKTDNHWSATRTY